MLKLFLWLHRQYSQDNIELFHVKITVLLNAGHQMLNWQITGHFGFLTTFPKCGGKIISFL